MIRQRNRIGIGLRMRIRIQNKKWNCQDGMKELQGYKRHWIV